MTPGECTVRLGTWRELGTEAAALRFRVFVHEQRVPAELELDEWDERSIHALACAPDGAVIGTGRLLPDGHIGRLAVDIRARGAGVGTRLLLALMQAARERGDVEVVLNAQVHVAPFYRRHGFVEEGEPFDDAGIDHIAMRRRL